MPKPNPKALTPLNILAAIRELVFDNHFQKYMLMEFLSRSDSETWQLWPSKELIAQELQLSLTTVKETLLALRELGFISWIPGYTHVSNKYTLHAPFILKMLAEQRKSAPAIGTGVDDLDNVEGAQ